MEKLRKLILISCLASLVLCLFQEGNDNFRSLYLLPVAMGLITLLFKKTYNSLKHSAVFYIFLIQAIIRYVVFPPLMASVDYSGNGSYSNNGEIAIFFIMLEILVVFLVFALMAPKQEKSYFQRQLNLIPIRGSLLLYIFLLVIFGYILTSGYLSKVNFIWNMGDFITDRMNQGAEQTENSNWAGILFNPFRILLILFLLSLIAQKKLKKSKKAFLYFLIILFSSLFIIGASRLSILRLALPLLFLVFLLIEQKYRRILVGSSIIGLIPILIISSIAKFTRGEESATVESLSTAASINAYFAGPGNVALGFDAYEGQPIVDHFKYFKNDFLHNFPGLSDLANYNLTTLHSFNRLIYGNFGSDSQIPPLNTYGLFHFGILGVFFYVPFMIFLALSAEKKAYQEKFIGFRYVFIAIALNTSLVFMLNLGSLFFGIASNLLFLYVPFYLINKVQSVNNLSNIIKAQL